MQTLVSHSVKTAGNKAIQFFLVGSKVQSMSSAMVPKNQRTIVNSAGAIRPMIKLICHALKPKKANHACTPSSALTVEVSTKLTL